MIFVIHNEVICGKTPLEDIRVEFNHYVKHTRYNGLTKKDRYLHSDMQCTTTASSLDPSVSTRAQKL